MTLDDDLLPRVRQGMRMMDRNGQAVGYVREVSGRSVLVAELFGRRVFWISGDLVAEVVGREARLRTAVRVPPARDATPD